MASAPENNFMANEINSLLGKGFIFGGSMILQWASLFLSLTIALELKVVILFFSLIMLLQVGVKY